MGKSEDDDDEDEADPTADGGAGGSEGKGEEDEDEDEDEDEEEASKEAAPTIKKPRAAKGTSERFKKRQAKEESKVDSMHIAPCARLAPTCFFLIRDFCGAHVVVASEAEA